LKTWIHKTRPDCILGHTNPLLDRLLETGLNIPRDLGFASLDWFERTDGIRVSGVEQNSRLVGAAAMQIVAAQILMPQHNLQFHPRLILIESSWIDGQTTRPQPTLLNRRQLNRMAKENSLNSN